nr:reverse transcriptase domain-containing protein [Tanacetum cinerariifolium]
MARRVFDYRIRIIVDRGNEEDGPDSRNISKIKGLRRRVRDLEIQHEIRQIRKRIRELELQWEMRKETESRYVVRDNVNEEEEFDQDEVDIDEGERLFLEQALRWIPEGVPMARNDGSIFTFDDIERNEEESEVIYDTDGNDVDDSPKFELLHPDQGESLVIQRVLSVAPSKSIDDDSWHRNNIFCTKYNSKDKVSNMINDRGSCENKVSTYMVEKLALKTVDHPEPYQFTWLKKRNAIKVSKRCLVEFSAERKYKDKVWCKVIPMDACHILVGFKKIKV